MLGFAVDDKILQIFTKLFPNLHVINSNETEDKKFLSLFIVKNFRKEIVFVELNLERFSNIE